MTPSEFLKALPGLDREGLEEALKTLVSDERARAVEEFLVFDETTVSRDEIVTLEPRVVLEKILEDLESEFSLHLCLEVRNVAPTVLGSRLEATLGLPPGFVLAGVPGSK